MSSEEGRREAQGAGQKPGDAREEGPGFVVIDKRGRAEPEPETAPPRSPSAREAHGPLPKPDFISLAISLGTSAMVHLGLVPDPETRQPREPDRGLARQAIDSLEMLQEKTRGNLDAEEERVLQRLLTDLRMRFVQAGR